MCFIKTSWASSSNTTSKHMTQKSHMYHTGHRDFWTTLYYLLQELTNITLKNWQCAIRLFLNLTISNFHTIHYLGHVKRVLSWNHGMVHSQVVDGGEGLWIWRVVANILNKYGKVQSISKFTEFRQAFFAKYEFWMHLTTANKFFKNFNTIT
jgi:hypothetical protein